MPKTAIVIPCYNEFDRLKPEVFLSFLNTNPDYFLLFVNDGSNDNTLNALNELKSKKPGNIQILSNKINCGKAESVRNGILSALRENTFEYICFLDADLSTPLEEIVKMVTFSKAVNKKVVFGSRLKILGAEIERNKIRHFIGRVFATLIGWSIKLPFYDTQCGAKVFHTNLVKISFDEPFITKWLFDVEIIMRLKKSLGSEIHTILSEYPLAFWKEVKGSKLNWRDTYRIPFDLLRVKLKY